MTSPSQSPRPYSGSGFRPVEELDLWKNGLDGYDGDADDPDYYDDVPGRGSRFRGWLGRVFIRLAWLGLAGVMALGSAGVVAATQHSPAAGGRPELTWDADQQLTARLAVAARDLAKLNDEVEVIGTQARNARAAVTQVNQVELAADIADGTRAAVAIDAAAADLNSRLGCGPWTDARVAELAKSYSPGVIDRYRQICAAIASVAPIHDDWNGMVSSGQVAMKVASDINDHDTVATDALQLATSGRYPAAISRLDEAAASISDATRIATMLAKVTDVSTLQTWLTRTKNMDDALRLLWQTVIGSKGRVTPQVKAALKNVNDAKALLPDDNAVLGVVLSELGLSMTLDGISIETAKGQLSTALSDLVGGTVFGR